MENRNETSLNGRTELLAALENLCVAMDHLLIAAESKLSSGCERSCGTSTSTRLHLSSPDESAARLPAGFESRASLVPRLRIDEELTSSDAAEVNALCLPERLVCEEGAFAGRLVQLQSRLGGFLK
jgi:hypothetical protein